MRLSISLLASLGIVGAAVAQTNNEFPHDSGATNFTTRVSLGGSSHGEICQKYPANVFNGIGQYNDAGGAGQVNRVAGMRYVLQDQSGITQEPFEAGLKLDDAASPGNPDPVNDAVRTGPFNTPSSTNTGAVAWIFTNTFATPFDGVPGQGDLYAFIDVPANAAWTSDGISVHMRGWGGSPVDNPNLTATIQPFVYTIDQSGPAPVVASDASRNMRIWITTPASVLRIGADIDPNAQVCPNPNYGCAGVYPDQNLGRQDGLSFKFVDANLPGIAVTVLGNFGPSTSNPPIPVSGFVPGSTGSIYLSLPWLSDAFAAGVTDGAGLYEQITFPFPFVLSAPVGVMTFQGFALDLANARIVASNLAGFDAQ